MKNVTTHQIDGDLNKNKTAGAVNLIQQLDALNSGKQDLKISMSDVVGPIAHGMAIINCGHSTINVDLLTEVSGDNGPVGAIITAAGKPGYRVAGFGATITLSANGPYPPDSKASALSADDKVIFQTLAELTGRKKIILDYIITAEKLTALDAKKCGIVDEVAQFRNKYSLKKVSIPNTPSQITPVVVAQQTASINSGTPIMTTQRRRGRPKAPTTAPVVA